MDLTINVDLVLHVVMQKELQKHHHEDNISPINFVFQDTAFSRYVSRRQCINHVCMYIFIDSMDVCTRLMLLHVGKVLKLCANVRRIRFGFGFYTPFT